ncbi:alpha-tocopherol transfer protein-like [Eupeodes corollae]|uniref:alpha-tocopherol transfer protein-like n=1 Tax=Eupeodes corollae TaxID=290404 RepID=UPI002493CB67|nr:alpha-tocopherol transfer protein-like [Eupeodes corollae]
MNIRKLSPELARKAEEDFGETYDRLQTDIDALRCWIEKQNHLISRKDDQFLVTFLRRCDFNLEDTKKRIDSFLTCKSTSPDIYKNRSVDETALEILKSGLVTIPPNSLPNCGPKVIISHFCKFDPKKHNFKDIVKVRFMLFEILAFTDDVASISGAELVFDLKNCSIKQAFYLQPAVLKKAVFYQEQCTPLRIKAIHIINMKKELQSIVQFARSIISAAETAIPVRSKIVFEILNY